MAVHVGAECGGCVVGARLAIILRDVYEVAEEDGLDSRVEHSDPRVRHAEGESKREECGARRILRGPEHEPRRECDAGSAEARDRELKKNKR